MKFKYRKTESLTYKRQYPWFWLLFIIGNFSILFLGFSIGITLEESMSSIALFGGLGVLGILMFFRKRRKNIRRFHVISESFKHDYGRAKSLADWYQIRRQFRALGTVYADIPFNEWVSFPQEKLHQYIDNTIVQKKREGSLSPTDTIASIIYETEDFQLNTSAHPIQDAEKKYIGYRSKEMKEYFAMIYLLPFIVSITLLDRRILWFFVIGSCVLIAILGFPLMSFLKYQSVGREENAQYFLLTQKTAFLREKLQTYFQALEATKHFTPEMSLVFADIIEILSESISQKQQALHQYHRFWKHITRPYAVFSSRIPEDVRSFFDTAYQELREDIAVVHRSVERFAQMESTKLEIISSQNHVTFGNSLLSQKRQAALIEGFEKIQGRL